MPKVFNSLAADAAIAGCLSPTGDELPRLLQQWQGPRPLMVCSGGTTSRCAAAQRWTLDLRSTFQTLDLQADHKTIRIGAGHSMGSVLDCLAGSGLTIATGLSRLPGMGFLLSGGVGPISRREGLAMDQLLEIRGVWGNGEPFALQRPCSETNQPFDLRWRALCGAAAFLAVVTDVTIKTLPLKPLWIRRNLIEASALPEWFAEAEAWSEQRSLQWHWGPDDKIQMLEVSQEPQPAAERIDGLHQLPPLVESPRPEQTIDSQRLHGEVFALLGPAAAQQWQKLLPDLQRLMRQRPHPGCSLAAQQIGGAIAKVPVETTSFVHRDAIWKPWITAAWPVGDALTRQISLDWAQQLRGLLQSVCPGVHLAQLHDHLPCHEQELEQAFGPLLMPLRSLKARLDPNGNLPSL
ncbi:MAG: FAD-linked oxidase [Cyanobium sp. NAT70]|nr:FAD-linked oxidase [Cyanobium sp. NAT70]